ncbi:Histone acetyltransferase type B catalytic subunit [Holothuria leucospilota]|uniref:Histone acetyltransferase type B catalytic subunit n=1 Tax=Holothuria leucospilota TaxID=206669 RepID=A0A9Q1C1T3_HOLLE|nr:Histone acetyltransferase type B catalytic subunit [Holothuria leucospilota]
MAESEILKTELAEYVCGANDVIELKLVRDVNDIFDDTKSFHPEFTHQLFGQNENIFGYKGLKIQLYFSAANLNCYLAKSSTAEVDTKKYDGVKPDDVLKTIIDQLEIEPMSSLDHFIAKLPEELSFQPMGELIHSYTTEEHEGTSRQYEIYKCDISDQKFREYHSRMQTFLWWYIDAASYIDVDDDKWMYYTILEKFPSNGAKQYAFVGYGTVYRYYAYPDKVRPRISQVLILPPFQKQGLGVTFLRAINNNIQNDGQVLDITVEDPSEDFVRIRDFIDCQDCSSLPAFSKEKLKGGFSPEMEKEAQFKFKINKKQARRVYEILKWMGIDQGNAEEVRSYRLEVKKRLNIPFQKQKSDYEKLKRVLKPEELTATMEGTSLEERQKTLELWYNELMVDYEKVVKRLQNVLP